MTCSAISPGSRSTEPLQLALNAAEDRLQLVLGSTDGALLHAQEFSAFGRAMPLLAPSLQHAFDRLGLNRQELKQRLQGIACVRGPGNFTGLRLSLATALGLAASLDVPLAGVDYLPLLGSGPFALLPGNTAHQVWVVTHARQNEVYLQAFSSPLPGEILPEPLFPAATVRLDEISDLLGRHAQASALTLVLGSGVRRNEPFFSALELPSNLTLLPPCWDHAPPWVLLRHALEAEHGAGVVAPLYLRESDAEESLPQLACKQGHDPEQMRAELDRLRDQNGS